MESYRRIRSEERATILVLVQNGKNQADIAKALGRNQSSLSRELAKGLEKGAYRKSSLKIDVQTWEVPTCIGRENGGSSRKRISDRKVTHRRKVLNHAGSCPI